MSPDVRYIPAKDVDASRIELYPYTTVTVYVDAEYMMPSDSADSPLGEAYKETPEEAEKRLMSVDKLIEKKLAEAEKAISEKMAQTEQAIAEKRTKAEEEAAETAQRAYEEGYAAGQKEGRIFGESQFKMHLAQLEDSLEALSDSINLCRAATGDEVLALITAMAEYLAGQHIEGAIDSAGPLLRSVLEAHPLPLPESAAPGEPAAVLFMHPRDLELFEENSIAAYPGVRLIADPELSRGSLKLETADTVLDATFERRRQSLLQLVSRHMEGGLA